MQNLPQTESYNMFRLPVCPHCKTVYYYNEVIKNNEKISTCYNCKGRFRKSKVKGYLILFLIIAVVTVAVNILIINFCRDILAALIPVFIFSIIMAILGFLISPFFVKYVPVGEVKKTENTTIDREKVNGKIKRSVKNRLRKENSESK